MRKLLAALFILTLSLSLFAGCAPKTVDPQPDPNSDSVMTGTLTIAGSTSVQPFSDLLKEAFEAKYPAVTVNIQGGGSSAGGTAALSGAADIGALSRELKTEELDSGLKPIVIAKDGIAIIVHNSNLVKDLSLEQIAQIFSGEIKNWNNVGGANKEINVINRESSSGTRGAFKDIVLGKELDFDPTFIEQGSTGAVKAAVQSDPNAIGYISLASLDDTVKGLEVDGAVPNVENIVNASYPVARPFNYATVGDATGLVKAFIDFTLSLEGQFLAEDIGLIPINSVNATLTIAGSTSVQPYSDLLKESFEKIHPNITVNVQGGGSSAGGTAALSGAADIGALSRELKPAELEGGLIPIVIAKDGIAIILHNDNVVDDLSLDQIAGIFAGEITNWKDVGGHDALINAVNRESSSGTRGAFQDIVLAEKEFDSTLIEQGSTGAVKAAVQKDPNAIGYISLASLDGTVKGLSVDGARPSVENIINEMYSVARPFNYATNGNANGLAKSFIDFTLSGKGQELAESIGLIAVK